MNVPGRSMIAIAVTRALRKHEAKGSIRQGLGVPQGSRPDWAAGWVPGMDDGGGLGPIPQETIDEIAEDVVSEIENQLVAAEAASPKAPQRPQERLEARERPGWLGVIEGGEEPAEEPEEVDSDG